ncbi:MAG: sugar phosphate nucleotidyltransferase [Clostridia bacterium]|nr:sugar phosphate nucleotidyltransferase [Clostridia bacterium]
MDTTLVVMAAGMASRYGGNKQITGMGPNNEILLEYSVCDAMRAGFNKVVFIIRPDMLDAMKQICGDKLAKKIKVEYAFQDYSSLPAWYSVPEGRTKPFGTVHAVLCARECVHEPFAVINADDYYGVDSFQKMHDYLVANRDASKAAMVGYRLKNTVSIHGAVTRGVCKVVDGRMVDVDEVAKIRLYEDGRIADTSAGEPGRDLDPNALVSMNFWGFQPEIFDSMQTYFEGFLKAADPADIKAECLLPVMVHSLLEDGAITVDMLETEAVWFGVTYQEDRPLVQQALLELHAKGVYPEKL